MKAVSGPASCGEVLQLRAFARTPAGGGNVSETTAVDGKAVFRENEVVRMSTASRMVQVARSAALSAPEIRTEAVVQLRKALDAGQYNFSPHRVADKMVGRVAGFFA